ncbi:putative late blight resistance protein homolog R1B-16 [Andrographis paniculata]|uniref:putative late blight resistance protein homolog R1B-16 n=1 Tax=Andrographis paniculata TaxID=175694 RepID=UPI0021E87AF2|nr:putative late blight resistance protein homolog R1B-16 [Andrographis paniculata]
MAAAYAALLSLTNTITLEQTPRHPQISIDDDGGLIEALQERVDFFVGFLESGPKKGADHFENQIAEAAYAAEDAIESYMVDRVLSGDHISAGDYESAILCQNLSTVIQEMDSIKNELELQINKLDDQEGSSSRARHGQKIEIEDLHPGSSMSTISSSKMVGFEDEKARVMIMLTAFDSKPSRTVVPIVGMGGVGKTTLARNIFQDHLIVEHFDVRAWVTVSQEYNVDEVLKRVLSSIKKNHEENENLGEQVHKSLFGRRYLIVLDDMWSINVWNIVQRLFPDCCDGSRILVTSRLSKLVDELSTCKVEMKNLDGEDSWSLLRENVFGQTSCPLELLDVGKKIARNCRGLPLAIVVVGGLLAKFDKTIEYWAHVAELSSFSAYVEDDEHCAKILSLSYNHLPIHLKPCFLYMGVFPEDYKIRVSKLVNVWIAEGFLKPVRGMKLEEIAEKYLLDLIDRNLIMVHEWGSRGKVKSCGVHDLLRELTLREAQKRNFLCVVRANSSDNPPNMTSQRRISIRLNKKEFPWNINSLLLKSHPRSLIVSDYKVLSMILRSNTFEYLQSESFYSLSELRTNKKLSRILRSLIFGLLRVIFVIDESFNLRLECDLHVLFSLVNLRYIDCVGKRRLPQTLASSFDLMRNLQVLIVKNIEYQCDELSSIWTSPQIHHVRIEKTSVPERPLDEQRQHPSIVLENLWTLKGLKNFRFDEGVVKKIRDINKMNVTYVTRNENWSQYSLHNLGCLQKLESLYCSFYGPRKNLKRLLQNISFPHSLKKLSLYRCAFWENMTAIGSLPKLQVLKLQYCYFDGAEWSPVEGEFLSLKYLYLKQVNLANWNADSANFPRLEQLLLHELTSLNEIPLDIGEIATLKLIQLEYCSKSAAFSAQNILEEQESLGNDGLVVKILD